MLKSAKTMVPYRLAFLLFTATVVVGVMDTKYSWIYLDYTFSSLQQRESAIRSGKFIPENCVIIDVDVFQGTSEDRLYFNSGGPFNSFPPKRVFVSIPRIKTGNPASLAEVVTGESNSALLAPFPNWKYHQFSEDRPHCENSIISIFRMKIDELGRLWVVDTGRINQFASDGRSICPPKLMIFDLKNNDKLIKLYTFPSNQYRPESLFTNIVVDVGDVKGRSTYAYITDTTVYKLIVYDFKNDQSWVIDQAYMYPYPNKGHFNINGVTFPLMDGVLGLALGPVINKNRKLYFHAFASVRESWVYTSTLQNRSLYENGLVDGAGIFFTSAEVRPIQSSVQAMTNDGILFSAMMDNSLACWNAEDPFLPSNINVVYKNDKEFQFPTGLKVIGDKIWAVAGQLQNHFTTLVQDRSVKYRILVGQVDELIRGSVCDKSKIPEMDYYVEDIVAPAKLFENNAIQALSKSANGVPWSYSSSSKIIEDVEKTNIGPEAGRYKRRMAVVMTGNTNLHGNKDSQAGSSNLQNLMSYDCRMIIVNGQLINQNCSGQAQRKRNDNPFR